MTTSHFVPLSLGLCLCSTFAAAQDTTPTPAPPTPDSQHLHLRLKPRLGAFYMMRLSARQEVEIGADTSVETKATESKTGLQKIQQNVSFDFNWKLLKLLPNGDSLWRFWILATRFERIAPGAPAIRYDSRRPPQKVPEQAELFHLMLNTGLTFRLDARGRIVEVREADQMADAIWKKMGLKNIAERQMLQGMLKRELGNNAFRNLGVLLAAFPARHITIGDSWAKNDRVATDWGLIYAGQCTLQTRDKGIATIERNAKVAPDPRELKKPVAERQLMPITGVQRGAYTVEEATGHTRSSLLTQDFQGRVDETGFIAGNNGRSFLMNMTLRLDTIAAK